MRSLYPRGGPLNPMPLYPLSAVSAHFSFASINTYALIHTSNIAVLVYMYYLHMQLSNQSGDHYQPIYGKRPPSRL